MIYIYIYFFVDDEFFNIQYQTVQQVVQVTKNYELIAASNWFIKNFVSIRYQSPVFMFCN